MIQEMEEDILLAQLNKKVSDKEKADSKRKGKESKLKRRRQVEVTEEKQITKKRILILNSSSTLLLDP